MMCFVAWRYVTAWWFGIGWCFWISLQGTFTSVGWSCCCGCAGCLLSFCLGVCGCLLFDVRLLDVIVWVWCLCCISWCGCLGGLVV